MSDVSTILAISGAAAVASPLGGLIALWVAPTTLFMSMALGFAGGVILGTIAFSILPEALELGSLGAVVAGFSVGFLAIYGFDLYLHHGLVAGMEADQHRRVERFYRRRHVHSGVVTVLAGGTSIGDLIEGLSIGIGTSIKPGLGLLIALAIVIDNMSESLGIGELIRNEQPGGLSARRIFAWTSVIGLAVVISALAGWYFLQDLSRPVQGFLFSLGGGGMFYLTLTDLIPEAEERQYQQSAALASALGFMLVFVLSRYV